MKSAIAIMLALLVSPLAVALDWKTALDGAHRDEANKSRDSARHPRETLEFFGLSDGMTVVEVSPGGGWYTEVIAALMHENGTYYAAHHSLNAPGSYARNSLGKYLQKLAADTDVYGEVVITQLRPPEQVELAPAGSADMVVAFRNVHSWMRADALDNILAAIHTALKPGGVFGVVQHRAAGDITVEQIKESGYVPTSVVIEAAKNAGFELAGQSEINANPKDTADHPKGVWSLPPVLRGGDVDRERLVSIGESDRMTLKFVKPGA